MRSEGDSYMFKDGMISLITMDNDYRIGKRLLSPASQNRLISSQRE